MAKKVSEKQRKQREFFAKCAKQAKADSKKKPYKTVKKINIYMFSI